jgi:hypothetical protein
MNHSSPPPEVAAASIRAATIIGTPPMREVIASYASAPGELVDQEITRAYQIFDDGVFEKEVLKSRDELFGVKLSELGEEVAECFKLLLRYKRVRQDPSKLREALHNFQAEGKLDLTGLATAFESDEDEEELLNAQHSRRRGAAAATGGRTRANDVDRISRLPSLK